MKKCDRCGAEMSNYTMSWFNTDDICLSCEEEEKAHPDYRLAREKEREATLSGDYNFPGVGWPGKDGRVVR